MCVIDESLKALESQVMIFPFLFCRCLTTPTPAACPPPTWTWTTWPCTGGWQAVTRVGAGTDFLGEREKWKNTIKIEKSTYSLKLRGSWWMDKPLTFEHSWAPTVQIKREFQRFWKVRPMTRRTGSTTDQDDSWLAKAGLRRLASQFGHHL